MATSEYLRNEGSARRTPSDGPSPIQVDRRGRLGASAAATATMMFGDVISILIAFLAALGLRVAMAQRFAPHPERVLHESLNAPAGLFYLFWFIFAYVIVARRYGLYNSIPANSGFHEIRLVIQGCLTAGLLLCGALYMLHGLEISRLLVLMFVATSSAGLSTRRTVWRHARFREFAKGVELRNVVVLGTNQLSYALASHIQHHPRLGCRFVGFIARSGSPVSSGIAPVQILGGMEKIRVLTRQHFIDEIVIAEFYPASDVIHILEQARELDIDIRSIAGYYSELAVNAPVEYLGIFPVASLHRRKPTVVALFCKRIVDVILSFLALLVTAPLLMVIAAAIRLESPGPALYVSERVGKRGRSFPCFKFRTMVDNAERMREEIAALNERDCILFKVSNDPRVTRLGRFLRKYSLDELPQFLNVLRGEMSIVGPRPPVASEVEKYELEHFRRLEVMPGLTGLWQIHARRDPSFEKYIELDTAYVENWSFWLDVRILLRTARVVLQGTGV